jgi:hypothetical protein
MEPVGTFVGIVVVRPHQFIDYPVANTYTSTQVACFSDQSYSLGLKLDMSCAETCAV